MSSDPDSIAAEAHAGVYIVERRERRTPGFELGVRLGAGDRREHGGGDHECQALPTTSYGCGGGKVPKPNTIIMRSCAGQHTRLEKFKL